MVFNAFSKVLSIRRRQRVRVSRAFSALLQSFTQTLGKERQLERTEKARRYIGRPASINADSVLALNAAGTGCTQRP